MVLPHTTLYIFMLSHFATLQNSPHPSSCLKEDNEEHEYTCQLFLLPDLKELCLLIMPVLLLA